MEETSSGIPEKTLARVQAYSGLAFATFLVLHLINTILATIGQDAYDSFQRGARLYYQFPLMEAGIILAATVHIWAGLVRMFRRRKRSKTGGAAEAAPPWRIRLHRWSGYYLLAAIYGHILATRASDWFFDTKVDFSFLTFSMKAVPAFFYPYYALLFASGFYHLTHGVVAALKMLGAHLPAWTGAAKSKPFWAFVSTGAVLGLLGVLAFGGNLFELDTHRLAEWQAFWEKILPPALQSLVE